MIAAGEKVLLEAMQKMAVIMVATSVRRANLLSQKQDHGQTCREFYANVRSSAATCDYKVACPHECCQDKPKIDYTPQVVKDVLIAGIADSDIRKDVLGWSELDSKADKEVVAFVEEKEIAKNAFSNSSSTNAMSGYRRSERSGDHLAEGKRRSNSAPPKLDPEERKKLSLTGKCPTCHAEFNLYIKFRSGNMNKEPFKLCQKCHKLVKASGNPTETNAIMNFIASIESKSTS